MNIGIICEHGEKERFLLWLEKNVDKLNNDKIFVRHSLVGTSRNLLINVEDYDESTDTCYIHAIKPFKDKVFPFRWSEPCELYYAFANENVIPLKKV